MDLPNKENLEPWYLALNPLGMLPTLVDQGRAINESSVICEYLEDVDPKPPLRPIDLGERAKMRWWMSVVDDRLHYSAGALENAPRASRENRRGAGSTAIPHPRPGTPSPTPPLVEHGVDNPDFHRAVLVYTDTVRAMEETLADNEWLAGDQFSLADCALLPYFQVMAQMGWDGLYKEHPNVVGWFGRGQSGILYEQITDRIPEAFLETFSTVGARFNDLLMETIAQAA